MAFESLAHRHVINLPEFPDRWLPLLQLYDPDLPLFPVMYFHRAKPMDAGARPLDHERVFGYVESVAPQSGGLEVVVVTNKLLSASGNAQYLVLATTEIVHRLGLADPVTPLDLTSVFTGPFSGRDPVLQEIWQRVVANAYGDKLPFGRLWDEVMGLARFVASWYSQSGRKGELIQTHYFAKKFGVEIQTADPLPQRDFFLLPSITELQDATNPLTSFPSFAHLLSAAAELAKSNGYTLTCGGATVTGFKRPWRVSKLNTAAFQAIVNAKVGYEHQAAAAEAFNAFGKGPARTIIGLFLLHDIRSGNIKPAALSETDLGALYDGLRGSYMSPKVIAIYAQQCFGNPAAIPIDMWIQTFFQYPLAIDPRGKGKWAKVFANSVGLGKVERLIWVTAQARKVHSRACDDAVWCIKLGTSKKVARGANPLSCTACRTAIRLACPAYDDIRSRSVKVNARGGDFRVAATGPRFTSCRGRSACGHVVDEFTTVDRPEGFAPYPVPKHKKNKVTVEEFVGLYRTGK